MQSFIHSFNQSIKPKFTRQYKQQIYIFKIEMYQFALRLAVTSYRRRHHGNASSASL